MQSLRLLYPIYFLLIAAAAGATLRTMALLPSWQSHYEPLLHAHSHISLLGWGYTAVALLLVTRFVPKEEQMSRFFRVNWLFTQFAIIGMFISFAIQGYGAVSITFSTLHILLSYGLAGWLWKKLKARSSPHRVSVAFARASLVFMVLSSLGPWSLAILSANHFMDSPWYKAVLYFYLHCQYNGWFTLGLFAVLYSKLEQHLILRNIRLAKIHFGLYTVSILPSFLLSLLWMKLPPGWHALAVLSGLMQAAAVAVFFLLWLRVKKIPVRFKALFLLSMACLALKMVLELGSAVPVLESLVFANRSVVIGYLHLVLLGFVSCMAIALLLEESLPARSSLKALTFGCKLFIAGFMYNELLLFTQGLMDWIHWGKLPFGSGQLLIASILLLCGAGIISAAGTAAGRNRDTA